MKSEKNGGRQMQLFKKLLVTAIFLIICCQLYGCGETVQGVKKDAQRMGKGVKTIFIRDGK